MSNIDKQSSLTVGRGAVKKSRLNLPIFTLSNTNSNKESYHFSPKNNSTIVSSSNNQHQDSSILNKINESFNDSIFDHESIELTSTTCDNLDSTESIGKVEEDSLVLRTAEPIDETRDQQGHTSPQSIHVSKQDASPLLRYHCSMCNQSLSKLSFLSIHNKFHSHSNDFTCAECLCSFENVSDLSEHCQKHASIDRQCPQCLQSFNDPRVYKMHLQIHILEMEGIEETENVNMYIAENDEISIESIYSKLESLAIKNKLLQLVELHPCHDCHLFFSSRFRLSLHSSCHPKMRSCLDSFDCLTSSSSEEITNTFSCEKSPDNDIA